MFLNFRCLAIMRAKNKVPSPQSPCERWDNYTPLINGLFRGEKVTFSAGQGCVAPAAPLPPPGGLGKPLPPRQRAGHGPHGAVRGLGGEHLLITSENKCNLVMKDLSIPDL